MKTIKFLPLALLILSCEAEEPQPVVQDCNCDRVVSHTRFNLPTHSWGEYVTVNDCTGIQVNGNWNTNWGDAEPVNGECL
jgi:hypothetical protein